MSRYEVLFVRMSLVYLVLTGLLGALFTINPSLAVYFRVTHVHLGVIGFFLSLVMGVAYWLMPRPGGLRQEKLERLTFYTLNAGLLLRLVAEPWWQATLLAPLKTLTVLSGLLLLSAMLIFAYAMQARVKTAAEILKIRGKTGNP
jgi:cbb3-type cytochrome oxidase subunit 1